MIFVLKRGTLIQILAAILASFAALCTGLYCGWSSPITTYFLSEENNFESGPMTVDEISLITSLLYIGAMLGGLLSGWLVNKIGRKWSLLVWFFPQIPANILIIVAKGPILILVSRFISGTIIGCSLVVPSIFIAETVESKFKASIGTLSGAFLGLGIFLSKLLTGLFGIYAVPVFCIVLTLVFIGCFIIFPDTPEYLIFCTKFDEAEKSLRFYRGLPADQPLTESYAVEFEQMKEQVSLRSQKNAVTLKDFSEGTTILAIIINSILTCTFNFTGVRVTNSFNEVIIKNFGIQEDYLSLIDTSISFIQFLGSFISFYLVQRLGIRIPHY